MKNQQKSTGAPTTFKDQDGNVIKIHDYVKDSNGNRYYINSFCQAVPDGSDAPAIELEKLIETSPVSIMTIEEVLNVEPISKRRRGGRRKATLTPEDSPSPEKTAAEKEADAAQAAAEKEAAAAQAAAERQNEELHPVTKEMIVRVLPDDVLANELRRRGYTLCAVRPALIEL